VFATGGTDARVKLWDFETGALIINGLGHSASVASLHFSPDDRQLVSVGADGCVFVWNIYEL
jgi:WD40 repeat protein